MFTTNATSYINSFASSAPLSIYFLSFLNYFTLSSIYVLLNFPIPEEIYQYLALMYQKINASLFDIFGIKVFSKPKSDEKVSSDRGIHFGVTSDVLSSQLIPILVMVGNIALIFLIQWILSFLKKNNYIKRLWRSEKWFMISGHVVNVLLPLTLPWTFVMLESGVKNFNTKLNAVCYLILYFLCLFFPIFYFFELL